MKSYFVRVLGNTPFIRMLSLLIEGRGLDYTLKDIAECAEVSWPTVQKKVPELLKLGIVIKTKKLGRIQLYRINETSPIAQKLIEFDKSIMNTIIDEVIAHRDKRKLLA